MSPNLRQTSIELFWGRNKDGDKCVGHEKTILTGLNEGYKIFFQYKSTKENEYLVGEFFEGLETMLDNNADKNLIEDYLTITYKRYFDILFPGSEASKNEDFRIVVLQKDEMQEWYKKDNKGNKCIKCINRITTIFYETGEVIGEFSFKYESTSANKDRIDDFLDAHEKILSDGIKTDDKCYIEFMWQEYISLQRELHKEGEADDKKKAEAEAEADDKEEAEDEAEDKVEDVAEDEAALE